MKLGFLFGAGAEVAYGLPSGGQFALDIFKFDTTELKANFKEMRSSVCDTTTYATEWLPDDYLSKNIGVFGSSVFQNIIKDTVEHKRDRIVSELNNLDTVAKSVVAEYKNKNVCDIDDLIKRILQQDVSNVHMGGRIGFTKEFERGNKLFNSCYFSALLLLYKKKDFLSPLQKLKLGKTIVSIIQLQVGALGEELARKINDGLFSKKDDDIDVLDSIGEIIQLNYSGVGVVGLEYLLEPDEDADTDAEIVVSFGKKVIERIYASVLDYKTLIDSNWHYLYSPRSDWAKFCKMCIFLMTVRKCIYADQKSINKEYSYYDDLKDGIEADKLKGVVATTNYNEIIDFKLGVRVSHLNGSTNSWYDPYANKIFSCQSDTPWMEKCGNDEFHIVVPLLFTQSGTKPMTSIEMAHRYVDIYEERKKCDRIVVVGYGFGVDDEHINGILRTLIDDDNKQLVIVERNKNVSEEDIRKVKARCLKVRNVKNIRVVQVSPDTRKVVNKDDKWLDVVGQKELFE